MKCQQKFSYRHLTFLRYNECEGGLIVYGGISMKIEYKQIKDFNAADLQRLFLSVSWESGNYPKKLVRAIHNSTHVISAWDGSKLVGLVRALDDGETVAFQIGRASCRERV